MTIVIVIIVILALVLASVVGIYNRLIGLIEEVRNNERQINIQLDRRYKVFESLINVVKNYMDYERSTLKDVVALRNQALSAKAQGDASGAMAAENKISGILSGLNVVFEQYPDLKANQNALQLQEEIVNTENKLAFSKQAYNDSVERYNATKKSFFQSMVVSSFPSKLDFNFPYWNLGGPEKIKEREDYTVKM
ncbi:MAG: LemA family protein [Proteobacteria bacterium]|nr:LemA family protein [Pseudomonadota bacterium]